MSTFLKGISIHLTRHDFNPLLELHYDDFTVRGYVISYKDFEQKMVRYLDRSIEHLTKDLDVRSKPNTKGVFNDHKGEHEFVFMENVTFWGHGGEQSLELWQGSLNGIRAISAPQITTFREVEERAERGEQNE